jgi:hypothetical protein
VINEWMRDFEDLVFRKTPEGLSLAKTRDNWPFPEPEPAHKREPASRPEPNPAAMNIKALNL